MNIGIDVDGVICNFIEGFKKVVEENYGCKLKEEYIIYHDLDMVLGISKNESLNLIEKTLNIDLPLIKDADKYISLLKNKHKIILLTARHINHQLTQKWLKSKNIKYDELHFLTEGNKSKIDLNIEIIIEDNLKEALKWIPKVKYIILFDHPWNQSLNIKNILYRARNWEQIYEIINKISKEK